jgi:hypothetical protein
MGCSESAVRSQWIEKFISSWIQNKESLYALQVFVSTLGNMNFNAIIQEDDTSVSTVTFALADRIATTAWMLGSKRYIHRCKYASHSE